MNNQKPQTPGINQPVNPAPGPAKKNNSNLGAQVAGGVAAGGVLGTAAGVGGYFAAEAMTHDEEELHDELPTQPATDEKGEEHHHASGRHEHHHAATTGKVNTNVPHEPKMEVNEYDIIVDEEGNRIDIASFEIDGKEGMYVDWDGDGKADQMWVDRNGDGIVQDNEVKDVSRQNVSMDELYARNTGEVNVYGNDNDPITPADPEVVEYGQLVDENGNVIEGAILEADGRMGGFFDVDGDGVADVFWEDLNDNKIMDDDDYYQNIEKEGIAMKQFEDQYAANHPEYVAVNDVTEPVQTEEQPAFTGENEQPEQQPEIDPSMDPETQYIASGEADIPDYTNDADIDSFMA